MNKKKFRILVLGLFTALLISGKIVLNKYFPNFQIADLQTYVESYGSIAPIVFICLYSVFIVLLLPGSFFSVLGGFIFGTKLGVIYNMTAAMLGSSLSFLIARYLLGDWVKQKTSTTKLSQLMKDVEAGGWQFVAFLRLVPLFPFSLLNYLLGLTTVKFKTYFFSSLLFMLPGCFTYTYIGTLGIDLASGEAKQIITKLLIISLFLAITILLTNTAQKFSKPNDENMSPKES